VFTENLVGAKALPYGRHAALRLAKGRTRAASETSPPFAAELTFPPHIFQTNVNVDMQTK